MKVLLSEIIGERSVPLPLFRRNTALCMYITLDVYFVINVDKDENKKENGKGDENPARMYVSEDRGDINHMKTISKELIHIIVVPALMYSTPHIYYAPCADTLKCMDHLF